MKTNLAAMTQEEIKALASEIVGDGQTPNMYFVTTSPYIRVRDTDSYDDNSELLEDYTESDSETKLFTSLEMAERYYMEVELNVDFGIGSVVLEDRLTGVIYEKYLQKSIEVVYREQEHGYGYR